MMNTETFPFTIGNFKCFAVSDGTFNYRPPLFPPLVPFLFANASTGRLNKVMRENGLQPEQWTEWVSPYICLVIDTGEHTVLVDTGAGNLGPHTGHLPTNLQFIGISPKDIDTVILTHGHPDHIGGNVDSEDRLVFPNARFVMWKDEWEFWTSDLTTLTIEEHVRETLHKVAQTHLPPIHDRLQLVDREFEILPGIFAVAAPGHTPGHMGLIVSSHDEYLLCIGDAVLRPIHGAQPAWHAVVDVSPDQVEKTRHRLFNRATEEQALVLAFHFPFPGLGHIVQKKECIQWQPI